MMVQLFMLSETRRATLDYIPIDRSDRNLWDECQKQRKKWETMSVYLLYGILVI